MELYPLRFNPILKDRLWGGHKLREVLGKNFKGTGVGESWELSGVDGDVSLIDNGPYKGKSLKQLIQLYPNELLGKSVIDRFGNEFPILIKFIDAQKDLSIQLHPGDELAKARHNSFGKTEMWYVMDADPGAELIIGFKRDMSPEEYQQAMEEKSLPQYLHYEPVSAGDGFFINSGKIHAIGAGILLAEIQQSSDVTYRVYDFDRRDAQGNLRELHTELALDAMDFKRRDDFKIPYAQQKNKENLMVSSPYFNTSYLELDAQTRLSLTDSDSFTALVCVDGEAQIVLGTSKVQIKTGETVLIPAAATEVTFNTSKSRFLKVSL
ncbi:MAG: type I phosphomannose isomerase catalytic subunit [Robiginitalea sp.]|uniref:type I phosphomannose isomerase catalytic subunit n=1 Tax=Robiginitalea sp. TaxID=1902411 RepID=UPI003C72DC9A